MSDINNINNLETTVHNKPIKSDHKTEYIANFNKFFDTFKCSVTEYDDNRSIENINDYYNDYVEYGVIPYMDITNYIYTLRDNEKVKKSSISQNLLIFIDKLYYELIHIEDKNSDEYKKIHTQYQMVFRIYAHTDLANIQSNTFYQISDSVKDEIDKRLINDIKPKFYELDQKLIRDIKPKIDELDANTRKNEKTINNLIDKFNQDMKKSERDYITILGIFIAIILSFIGAVIFPIELIENVSQVSIARLLLLLTGIAFIFINTLYLLIKFIIIINDKEKYIDKLSHICVVNYILLFVFLLSLITAFLTDNIVELQQKVLENSVEYKQNPLDNNSK